MLNKYLPFFSWAILPHLFKLYLSDCFSKWNWKKIIIAFKTFTYIEEKKQPNVGDLDEVLI